MRDQRAKGLCLGVMNVEKDRLAVGERIGKERGRVSQPGFAMTRSTLQLSARRDLMAEVRR